ASRLTGTCRSRSASRRRRRSSCPRSSGPFRTHLRKAVHVHGHPLALLFVRQLLQQLDRTRQVLLDRRLRGREVEALDLGNGIHRREVYLSRQKAEGARQKAKGRRQKAEPSAPALDRLPEYGQWLRVQDVITVRPGAAGDECAPLRECEL